MNRFHCIALGAALLSGCGLPGNPEDFVVETKASPDKVVAALSEVTFGETQMLFGKVPITRERAREGELGWTIQSSNFADKPGDPGKVALTFEPVGDGQGTRIHVAISVPPVKMLMGEANKVLSEERVESEFRKVLEQMVKSLDSHGDTTSAAVDIGRLLSAVAVAANPKLQARANHLEKNPQALADRAEANRMEPDPEQADQDAERDDSRDYRSDAEYDDTGRDDEASQGSSANEYAN